MCENEDLDFTKNKRHFLPKTYNDRKLDIARGHNEKLDLQFNDDNDSDDAEEQIDLNKQAIFEEVSIKMNAMSNLYMDLTEEEVDLIQNIVEKNDSDIRYDSYF